MKHIPKLHPEPLEIIVIAGMMLRISGCPSARDLYPAMVQRVLDLHYIFAPTGKSAEALAKRCTRQT